MTYRVLVLDTAAQTHNSYIALAIVDALQRHPAVEWVRQADYGNAIDLFRREGCDTVLALGGSGADLAVLGRLCAMAARSVLWTTEDPYELEENLRVAAPFDLVCTNDLGCLPAYGARGRHLPLAGSRLFHDHPPVYDDGAFLYDICFVGTAWPNRVDTINRILDGVKRPLRLKIGLPTNPHLPPVVLSDASLLTNWRVPNPELARIANRSRITLSLERKFSSARPDQASGSTPPPRLFENALAGAFQIALGGRAEATRYFDESEIAFCDHEDELLARIAWALDHPEARIAMAQAARRRALAEHLYDHRVAAIVSALGEVARPVPSAPRAGRKRVLLVTHNVQGHQPGGGVEVYQQELAAGAGAFDVYTLYPRVVDGAAAYTLIAHRTGEQHLYGVPHPAGTETLHDAAHERVFEQVLIENDIDLVHFQHLIGMPLSLPMIARACGVPSLYTLHDFYLVCSHFNLLDYRGGYCNIAGRSPTECDICLSAAGIPAGAQQRRRNFVARMIEAFDVLVANSPFTANYLRAIYPEVPAERIRIVEMLTPSSHRAPTARPAAPDASGAVLKVAIPGNFTRPKGADTILRVLTNLRDEDIEFHVLGSIPDADLARHLRALALPRVIIRGGYAAHELPGLMAGMDVSLHLSVWPETYMISLNEARAAGAVPVISDLGAPAERVRAGLDGFKVAPDDAGHVCDILRDLARDRDRLETMRAASTACRIVLPAEHVAAVSGLYHELIAGSPVRPLAVTIRPERDYILSTRACGIRTNTPSWVESGSGWDEAPPRPAREKRAATVWRTFPARFAHLERAAARRERVRFGVDGAYGDRRPAAWPRIGLRSTLTLWGWAFVEGRGRPLDVVLHLKGDAREIYAVSPPVPRGDVRAHLDHPDAEASGFSFELDLEDLREGTYAIRLLQVYEGALVDLGVAGEAVVRRDGEQAPEARAPVGAPARTLAEAFRIDALRDEACPDPETATGGGDAAVTHYETGPAAGEEATVGLQGWAVNRARRQVFPLVAVGLVPTGGRPAWFDAERCRAPSGTVDADPVYAFAGFRAAVAARALEPGLHRIVVAESDRRETLLHETGEAVLVRAETGGARRVVTPCREVRTGPAAEGEAQARRAPPEHRLALDEVETGLGAVPGREAGSHLYLRGWAWVPRRGRADRLTLVLAGTQGAPGTVLTAVLPAARREDVAAHLGVSEAEWAGFEALVPTAALPPGRYEAAIQYGSGPDRVVLPLALVLDRMPALAA